MSPKQHTSIVLIEDDEDDYVLTRDMIGEISNGRFDLRWVSTYEAAIDAIQSANADVYLIDYRLGQSNGLDLLRDALHRGLQAPIILLTGKGNREIDIEAMRSGAADYLIKGEINSGILERSIRYAIERKHAERAIHNAEARYRTLVEQMPTVSYQVLLDHAMSAIYVSPQIKSMLGYTPDEWLENPSAWISKIHPDDRTRVIGTLEQSRISGDSFVIEYRITSKSGSTMWVQDRGRLLKGERGRRSNILQGMLSDITESKLGAARVATEKARAEAMVRIASRLSSALDLNMVLRTVCEEAAQALRLGAAGLSLVDRPRRLLSPAAAFGLPIGILEDHGHEFIKTLEQGLRSESGANLAIVSTPPESAALREHGIRSQMTVGISHGGKLIGALTVYDASGAITFGVDEEALLRGIADQTAQAVTNARLFAETRLRLERMQAVQAVEAAITSSFDLRLSLGVFCSQVRGSLNADAVAVYTVNESSGNLEMAASQGFKTDFAEDILLRNLDQGLFGSTKPGSKVRVITDISELRAPADFRRYVETESFLACCSIPLVAKSRIEGYLTLFQRSHLEPDKEWIDFLETLCYQATIAIDNTLLFEGLQKSNDELTRAYDATIVGWSHALDLRDKETEGHTRRVTEMSEKLGRQFGLGEYELLQLRRGALLHDIGKMGVPDAILLKAGPLTDEEWVVMKKHPQYAYDMLYQINYLRPAIDIPYCHHEKWDGSGYPRGLAGKHIPIAARLFAVVDVWDALRSDRPYRAAWTLEQVQDHIKAGSGSHFDPEVVDVFMQVIE